MSTDASAWAAATLTPMRLLLCILPDDGSDARLIRGLRAERGVAVADAVACRGVSILHPAQARRAGRLPEAAFVKLVQVLVPDAEADALFEYVYARAAIDRPDGGLIALSAPICATPYRLPDGVPDEPA